MDLYTLYAAIRDGIAQDGGLDAWAMSEFGRSIQVFSGISSDDFPNMDDDAPFVALGDPQDHRSQNRDEIFYTLAGWVGLTNGHQKTDIVNSNVIEPKGVKQIIDALRLVRLAIAAALPEGVTIEDFSTAADTLGAHDEVNGYFETSFKQGKLTIGTNALT